VALRYPLLLLLWLRCRRLFARLRPQAVLVSNGGYPGGEVCRLATIAAGARPGCVVVHLVHGVAQPPRRALRFVERWIDRRLDRAARVAAVSAAVARSLGEARAISQEPLVIANGLPIGPEPGPPPRGGRLSLLQVGYFDRNKNQAMAIRALAELRRAGASGVSLTFAGREVDRGAQAALEALAEAEGVASQIRFAGFADDMDALYAACDAVVLTSLVEGHPVSVLEAMRAGRAVVTTPAGGCAELVEQGGTGWVLPGWEPSDLAAVWRRWLEHPDELASWGAAARARFVRRYDVTLQADRLAHALRLPAGPGSQEAPALH
jgi:glycosyltransferase involved in cell wall biosynthesis